MRLVVAAAILATAVTLPQSRPFGALPDGTPVEIAP